MALPRDAPEVKPVSEVHIKGWDSVEIQEPARHPGVAAKVFRAMCIHIVDAGKSQYYGAALSNLEKEKNCYQREGLDAQWQALIVEIRRKHQRTSGFMPGFQRNVRGTGAGSRHSSIWRPRPPAQKS